MHNCSFLWVLRSRGTIPGGLGAQAVAFSPSNGDAQCQRPGPGPPPRPGAAFSKLPETAAPMEDDDDETVTEMADYGAGETSSVP